MKICFRLQLFLWQFLWQYSVQCHSNFKGLENDVFCQIGLVMLIGLASKNAILIVEFANQLTEQGKSIKDACIEACLIRFRPIMMTSLTCILGILPLVLAHGVGAKSRVSMGTAVFGGMLVSTFLNLFVTADSIYYSYDNSKEIEYGKKS